jgi:hypothetical protein
MQLRLPIGCRQGIAKKLPSVRKPSAPGNPTRLRAAPFRNLVCEGDTMEKIVSGSRINDAMGFVYSLSLAGLGLLGMVGIVYHALAPEGWFSGWLGRLWSQHPGFAFLVLIGLLTTVLVARNQVSQQRFERGGTELPFYFFVALGAFFAGRALIYGTL